MGSPLRLSCLPTWSSGTLPKHGSAACSSTARRVQPARRRLCLHSLNLHFNTIHMIRLSESVKIFESNLNLASTSNAQTIPIIPSQ